MMYKNSAFSHVRHTVALLITLVLSFNLNAQNGWTSLFNGKDLQGWKVVAGTATYAVEGGMIVGTTVSNSPNTFLISEKSFGDFIVEMEVKMEDSSSNSGIQFRSSFDPSLRDGKGEVYGYQFELDPSPRAWSGGIYEEARRGWLYPLTLNDAARKAYRHNEFNKVRIECVGTTITTYLNGIQTAFLIDSVSSSGIFGLQVHSISNPSQASKRTYWRNIRIRTSGLREPQAKSLHIVNTIPNNLSEHEKKQGYVLLFDGKSTAGWKGAYRKGFPEKGWEVNNGVLKVLPSGGGESTNGGDIVTEKKFKAFDLSFEFNLAPGANSGVKYFVTLAENNPGSAIGLEYQLLDDKVHPDAKQGRDGNRTLASLYDLIKADKQERFVNAPGKWNRARIVVHPDNRVEHYLNGMKVLEYVRGSEQYRTLVSQSKYKIWPNFGEAPEGHLLIQDHGDAVSFRSIRIKEL